MATATGSGLVVRTLQRAGVDVAFGLPGAHIDPILQEALDAKLRVVDVRHEMNAGHAAEGYARVTGNLGVAVVTAGGGFTNVLTSITNAYLDRTPSSTSRAPVLSNGTRSTTSRPDSTRSPWRPR